MHRAILVTMHCQTIEVAGVKAQELAFIAKLLVEALKKLHEFGVQPLKDHVNDAKDKLDGFLSKEGFPELRISLGVGGDDGGEGLLENMLS